MNVTIIGCGYVGLVTGACLADIGNDVCCFDVDHNRIATLESGGMPIHEPGPCARSWRATARPDGCRSSPT